LAPRDVADAGLPVFTDGDVARFEAVPVFEVALAGTLGDFWDFIGVGVGGRP